MATTISNIRATPVTVPLEAPLLHSNGAHWGRFVRTIVEVETSDGYVGLGEMGGGGEDATRAFTGLLSYLEGHDVFRSRRCASRSAIRPRACTTTARSSTPRSSSRASTSWARSSACPCMRC